MKYSSYRVILALTLAGLLGACNSTEQTLTPLPGDTVPQSGAASPGTPSATLFPQVPFSGSSQQQAVGGTLRFTPVIGAPVGAVTPLSRQLAQEAKNRGFTIVSTAGSEGDHVLKGYFSAFSDGTKTTIVFVWDVLDPSGNRLHRIQGQEDAAGSAPDTWSVVPASTMERIAVRTFDDYQAWRSSVRG